MDHQRQGREASLPRALRQRLFSDRTADAAVAVFERMNGLEVQMRKPCACHRRQGHATLGPCGVKPLEKPMHFFGDRR